jgi:hypothetical protein
MADSSKMVGAQSANRNGAITEEKSPEADRNAFP